MLPASDLTEILTNLSALNLQPNTAAQILAAVFAPLLRTGPSPGQPPQLRGAQLRERPRRAAGRRKYRRRAPAEARDRALAALRANPDATPTEIAKIAKVSRSTAVNARRDLAKEARKEARKQARKGAREKSTPPRPPDRRERAQRFLKDALAGGPKPVTTVEAAASKAHVDPHALDQARAELGVVTSRADSGAHSLQWSLPG